MDVEKLKEVEIIKTLSTSKLSTVYLAEDSNSQQFALKKINKEDKECEQNARKEIYFYQNVPQHKYILKFFGFYETNKHIYILLEYMPRKDLWFSFFANKNKCTEERLAKYIWQLCESLIHLKKYGVVHCDLKIENVLLTDDDDIRLCDFGLCYIPEYKEKRRLCGTVGCLSPEICLKNSKYVKNPKHTFDVWAIGVLLYEMMYRKSPFVSPDQEALFVEPGKGLNKELLYAKLCTPPTYPKNISKTLLNLFKKIFRTNAKFRISFSQIQRSKWVRTKYSSKK